MAPILLIVPLLVVLLAACGGDDQAAGSPSPPRRSSASGAAPASPTAPSLVPPLEGPPREAASTARRDFKALPEWQLPRPEGLPRPSSDAEAPEFHPPVQPTCPDGWQEQRRPSEGFSICYPGDWQIAGHGYVSAGAEEGWYSLGIVLFDGEKQVAHVSIYVVPRFARPFTYTRDCKQPYSVTVAGEPSVICPDFPGQSPEARIIAYHINKNERDYFVNVVPYFQFDKDANRYTDKVSDSAQDTAIKIAHTFHFIELAV